MLGPAATRVALRCAPAIRRPALVSARHFASNNNQNKGKQQQQQPQQQQQQQQQQPQQQQKRKAEPEEVVYWGDDQVLQEQQQVPQDLLKRVQSAHGPLDLASVASSWGTAEALRKLAAEQGLTEESVLAELPAGFLEQRAQSLAGLLTPAQRAALEASGELGPSQKDAEAIVAGKAKGWAVFKGKDGASFFYKEDGSGYIKSPPDAEEPVEFLEKLEKAAGWKTFKGAEATFVYAPDGSAYRSTPENAEPPAELVSILETAAASLPAPESPVVNTPEEQAQWDAVSARAKQDFEMVTGATAGEVNPPGVRPTVDVCPDTKDHYFTIEPFESAMLAQYAAVDARFAGLHDLTRPASDVIKTYGLETLEAEQRALKEQAARESLNKLASLVGAGSADKADLDAAVAAATKQ